jgi:hypothetical protein
MRVAFLVVAVAACGSANKPAAQPVVASPPPAPPPAPAPPAHKFQSDFSHDTLAQFEIFDAARPKEGPSRWAVRDGALHQDSNIFGLPDPPDGMKNPYTGSLAVVRDVTASDLTFTAGFKPTDNDGVGVVFGFVDATHYDRLISIGAANNGGPITRLDRIAGDSVTVLASSPKHYAGGGAANTLRVVVRGKDITASIDDTELHASDPSYAGGRIGVCVYAEQGVGFTNLLLDP